MFGVRWLVAGEGLGFGGWELVMLLCVGSWGFGAGRWVMSDEGLGLYFAFLCSRVQFSHNRQR